MRRLLLIALLFTGCAEDSLSRVCPSECWAVPGVSDGVTEDNRYSNHGGYILNGRDRSGIGQCKTGAPICDEENIDIIECVGEVLPSHEVCDGIDNDCNGRDDDAFGGRLLELYNTDGICRQFGVCSNRKAQCREAEWVCQYPSTYEDEETLCDGLDNDCDGRTDEDLFAGEYCYEAPEDEWWTASNPPCHPGVVQCRDGWKQCIGQVLPAYEVCDQIDNDCNGIVDDTLEVIESPYDIVFIVDTSGSMCGYIQAVAAALDAYVEQFEGNPYFRFALVNMSAAPPPLVQVIEPFGDITLMRNRLLSMGCGGSGSEASLDSVEMVCNNNDPLGLEWRPEANRLAFAFSDEQHQSYSAPPTTGNQVLASCIGSSTIPFMWGRAPTNFSNICPAAGGIYFTLSSHWEDILEDLNDIVVTLCGIP